MENTAIVLAGGVGSRMQSDIPKQFLMIHDKPVVYYSLRAFQDAASVNHIILVIRPEDQELCEELVRTYHLDKVSALVSGGAERYESVYHGLQAISAKEGLVLIHDGARPCINPTMIDRLCKDAIRYGSAVAAVPSKDTIKIADPDGYVTDTPPRANVWNIQTPQVFPVTMIQDCYEQLMQELQEGRSSAPMVTDDAMVAERYGVARVHLSMGAYENLKITTPEDMVLAEKYVNLVLTQK